MSGQVEQTRTITITVPYITETSGFREPRPCSGAMADGRRFVGAVRDERSVLIAEADIGEAVLAAWPGEQSASDWQERVLLEALLIPISAEPKERERSAAEIVKHGIPAVAYAIARAWEEGADAEKRAAERRARKTGKLVAQADGGRFW